MKLFLFPFAGGSANYFMSWKTLFNNNSIDIEPVELAGRGKRISDPLYNSISEAINDVYEWMIAENKLIHDSFAFFGHSMGGIIAYELAHKLLSTRNLLPEHLFLSGINPPHLKRKHLHVDSLNDQELLEEIIHLGGTPKELLENKELLDYFMPIIRSDFKIVEEYQYKEKRSTLDIPLSLLNGKDDSFEQHEIEAWRDYTNQSAFIEYYEGGHFYLNQQSQELAEYISQMLSASYGKKTNILS